MKSTVVITLTVHPPRCNGGTDPDFWVKADYCHYIVPPGWIRFYRWSDAVREISRRVVL